MKSPPWVWAVIAAFGACAFLFGCAEQRQFMEPDRSALAPYDYGAGKKP